MTLLLLIPGYVRRALKIIQRDGHPSSFHVIRLLIRFVVDGSEYRAKKFRLALPELSHVQLLIGSRYENKIGLPELLEDLVRRHGVGKPLECLAIVRQAPYIQPCLMAILKKTIQL